MPNYKRLRDMPKELSDAVRARILELGAQPNLTKESIAEIIGKEYKDVKLPPETIRSILRQHTVKPAATTVQAAPVTDEEIEEEKQTRQRVTALREENRLLKRKLTAAEQEQTALAALQKGVEIVTREASLVLPSFSRPEVIIKSEDGHVEEAVLFLSCWHYGEVVSPKETTGFGDYNVHVAQAAMQVTVDAVTSLIKDHHRGLHIRKLWVVEVGDSVSGDIHDELRVTNERPIVPQTVGMGLLRAVALRDLAAEIEQVEHVGIIGNHGRTTKKPAHKQKAEDSFDRMSYEYTSLLVSQVPNIKTTIIPSPKWLAEINGHRFLFEHGDSIRMWMGFPYYGASREQAKLLAAFVNAKAILKSNPQLAEYMSKGFRYFCFGNFHTSMVADGPNGSELIATGSPKGVDEYAWDFLSTGSLPSQQFFGVHHRRGVSFRYRLDLADRDPKKHDRYQFDLSDVSLRDAAGELGLL